MSALGTPWKLRYYERQDRDAAADVLWRTALGIDAIDPPFKTQAACLELVLDQERFSDESWVAIGADEVVGVMFTLPSYIDCLCIDPAWQRRGIGQQFMVMARQFYPNGFKLDIPLKSTSGHSFCACLGLTESNQPGDGNYSWKP